MPPLNQIYNIRIQVCQKCSQHYNSIGLSTSKSYHTMQKYVFSPVNQKLKNDIDFIAQQEEYRNYYQSLMDALDQLQKRFLQNQMIQNQQFNYSLIKQTNTQSSVNQDHVVPIFKIHKNIPYKYLSKLSDTRISTKRYLNNTTGKIVQFPRRDSFQIYFQNLLLFSKLSFQKWPDTEIISKIIQKLVQYCQNQDHLMNNLQDFINQYLDIKTLDADYTKSNLSLYQYLILTSDNLDCQIQTEQDQRKLINTLDLIISGKIKVLKFNTQFFQNKKRKDILPYSVYNPKIKAVKMKNIYLNNQISANKSKNKLNMSINTKRPNNKAKSPDNRTPNVNRNLRCPLSSNSGYVSKTLSTLGFQRKKEVFSMIKMGDLQKNQFNQQFSNTAVLYPNQIFQKQLRSLCSINKSGKIKKQDKITKQTKLFLSNKFNILRNQEQKQNIKKFDHGSHDNSIIWNKFKKEQHSKRRGSKQSRLSKSSQVKQQNKLQTTQVNDSFKLLSQKGTNNKQQSLKVNPAKVLKRASFFLSQNQQKSLHKQVKNIARQNLNKKRMSQAINSPYKIKPIKSRKGSLKGNNLIQINQRSFSSSESCSETKQHDFQGQFSGLMAQNCKLKVLRRSIQKRSSQKSHVEKRSSQRSHASENSLVRNNHNNNFLQIQQNMSSLVEDGTLVRKPVNKLSVKLRRKSSFYYSNTKNNSLLQLINTNQVNDQKQNRRQNKKPKKRGQRTSLVQTMEEGIQVNFEQQINQIQLNGKYNIKVNQSQINKIQIELRNGSEVMDSKALLNHLGQNLQEEKQFRKSIDQCSEVEQNGLIFGKNKRDIRISGLNRIPKYSFLNHFTSKDQNNYPKQNNSSKQKDQNEDLVAVFPNNKFNQAFIVNKFTQIQNYEHEIKRMFTTNFLQKSQLFDFQIKCEEQYRLFTVISLNKLYEKKPDKKLSLFPKIFKQIQKYSNPLVEVVNRLLKYHPVALSRLFTNSHGISPLGQYCIWIYHKQINQFRPVYINDQIPFFQQHAGHLQLFMGETENIAVYAPVANQHAIWFILLQKAMAKVLGSYYKIKQTSIGQIFSMITGCPIVDLRSLTISKLQRIFSQKIFQNKKAYIYALKKQNQSEMRIDRIIGLKTNQRDLRYSLVKIQERQSNQVQLLLQTTIRKYSEISLIFFNLNYFFNQISLPVLEKQQGKTSNLISFYIFNQQNTDKNDLYICLGGFSKGNLGSKILIYEQTQDQDKRNVKQLQMIDPLSYQNNKYIYQGQISKKGNYFFETQITYGKFLCLIQADYQCDHEYFLSMYSSRPVAIHDAKHNFIDNQKETTTALQRVINNNKLRRQLKKEKLQSIKQNQLTIYQYPVKREGEKIDLSDLLVPYDFSSYKNKKSVDKKSQSSTSFQEIGHPPKWIIQKKFIEDTQFIQQKKQRHISGIINQIQKYQHKEQNHKLKKQLRNNEKDVVLKMMTKVGENTKNLASRKLLAKNLQRKQLKETQFQDE